MSHQNLSRQEPALRVVTDPVLPLATERHRASLDKLRSAYTKELPLAILIDEGKLAASRIIGHFLDELDKDVDVVRISEPCSDASAFMRSVIHAIGFESRDLQLNDLESIFSMFLSYQRCHRHRTVVCIEETQNISWWVLDKVRRLVQLEKKSNNGLLVILSGRPRLVELFNVPPLDAIRDLADRRIIIKPLKLAETRELIRRLSEAAGFADISRVLEFDAITRIHELSMGVADTACDLFNECLGLAGEKDVAPVTTDLVDEAGEILQLETLVAPTLLGTDLVQVDQEPVHCGRLVVRINGVVLDEIPLDEGQVLIGRDELCDLCLPSRRVSRYHALIIATADGAKVVDLRSTNGTLVGGRRVAQLDLKNNDEIVVGECVIQYVSDHDQQALAADTQSSDGHEPRTADSVTPVQNLVHDLQMREHDRASAAETSSA